MTRAVRPLIMGVVNVTPDSFSDGGRWLDPDAAIGHGIELARQGADLLDVGGESTRPGAARPTLDVERQRVLPVVAGLVAEGLRVSVDTMRAEVAEAALERGATLVNDVSGGLADPAMAPLVADAGVPFVAMHWRAHSDRMDRLAVDDDVVGEVVGELRHRVDALLGAGLTEDQVVVDPGFGFSKNAEHNWALLRGLGAVVGLGHRVLVGTSRKRFLGRLDPALPADAEPAPPAARDAATAATSLLAAQHGVWAVRVHEVTSTRDALLVWEQVERARG